ncbi:MAG: ATP-binding cassette domain-containing protein, partial [Proteobacteria bacterium]|nr:ATP-binding cassette domain-containing protein [Pseudomonadota bacterium]
MSPLRRLLRLMRPQARWMALAATLSALATLAHAALLATSGWFITAMALAGLAGVLINYFAPAAMIRAFAIVRILGRYAERLVGHEATLRFVASLRPWLYDRLERGAPAASDVLRQGDVLTRLRGDIDRLEQAFLRVVSPVAAAVLVLVPVLLFLWHHDGRMALVTGLFAVLAGAALPAALHRRNGATARRLVDRTAGLNAALVEEVEGLAELAIYDPGRRHRAAVLATSDALVDDERRLATDAASTNAAVQLAANASVLAIAALGLPLVAAGTLAAPDVPMLALLALGAFEAIAPLPLVFPALTAVLASARRVFNLADRPAPVIDPPVSSPLPAAGGLAMHQLGFRYPDAAAATVEDVSLDLAPGRRVAIIGASGSGKSTLADLAAKLRAPGRGEIALAGVSYAALAGDDVRRRVSLLTQHDHLFSTTIRDNLLLARPGAS